MADTREEQLDLKLDYLYNTKNIFKTELQKQGVEISDKDTFRDYADKIKTINNSDVLLFKTEQEMEAYENPKEGVLAVVYQLSIDYIDTSKFVENIIFPEQVTLTQECVNNYNVEIYNQNNEPVGRVYLTPETFYFYITGETDFELNYTSTDGINYDRVEDITNPVDLNNPIKFEYISTEDINYIKQFMKCEKGVFGGLFKYIGNKFENVLNQFNLTASNQLLTDYSAYGANGLIIGDGSYISNIKTNEYINKYLPNIQNNTSIFSVIQSGTKVKPMEYVQRQKITISNAFNSNYPISDCIVQIADLEDISVENSAEEKVVIQNYLNSQTKYNYSFMIGKKAYRLYLGYNYSTTEVYDAFNFIYKTVPYQMTSLNAFIINLEDLSIYKTFTNNDTWIFTEYGFGDIMTYAYSVQSDCLVLISDMGNWYTNKGAYIGITTIDTAGLRNTSYHNVNYSGDYTFKSFYTSTFDIQQDCYYLGYRSAGSKVDRTIKRIVKITTTGQISSVYESPENMVDITSLWTNYFRNVGGIVSYNTTTKGSVLRNLITGVEIKLYGSIISDSNYFGIDENNIYVSTKLNNSDEYYNIYKIDKNTMEMTIIPNTQSTSRAYNVFYTYNKNLCIFMDNKVISLDGVVLDNFIKTMLNNPSISGIDKINEYEFKTSFLDYNLYISTNKFTAKKPVYKYYRYSNITELPIQNDICLVTSSKNSIVTNDNAEYYKYESLIITNTIADKEHLMKEISELQEQINNANNTANSIRGL